MADKKLKETVEFQIEFYDVDSMQVAWHGNYVKFMVVAQNRLRLQRNDTEWISLAGCRFAY